MPRIHVCSLKRLDPTVEEIGARDVLTLIRNIGQVERPALIEPHRHLLLDFSDILAPREGQPLAEGQILASAEQVETLLGFVKRWDRAAPLVIHCFAGVSRSTAGAFMAACLLRPDRSEADWAAAIRAASPTATPNLHLVSLADAMMGRGGRMVAAIEAIGRGQDCFEGVPFALDIGALDIGADGPKP
jgi:predicted protein tyrosine phosphatase